MRIAWIGVVAAVAGCDDPVTASAAWRIRCPPGTTPCDYAAHELSGPAPDPQADGINAGCVKHADRVSIDFSTLEGGPALELDLGVSGAGELDTSTCSLQVGETDGRQWRTACGPAQPSPAVACQILSATLDDGVAVVFRCVGMASYPVEAGSEADLAHASDPAMPTSIEISSCSTAAEVP